LIILGIDPGSRVTGYGIIESQGNQLKHLHSGALQLHKEPEMTMRLGLLVSHLETLFRDYHFQTISLEQAFFGVNVRSALLLGQVRGAVMAYAGKAGIPLSEYSATAVKKAITGYGRADKSQIQEMVRIILGLAQVPKPHDAADALALAICHAHSKPPANAVFT
jgi:crossover junction endodeoxyribonuclease RuvC